MKKIFSCLFVKFVLYTGRFLGEGTGFLFVKITAGGHLFIYPPAAVSPTTCPI